jgi:4-amino-4-deoxy-L-arabinose transferase-like glycosyltransferase
MHTSASREIESPRPSLTAMLWRPRRVRWLGLLLLGMSLLLNVAGSGASLPMESHEVYYARSATEMMRRGDYVVPYFNDAPRLRKPPLNYWLIIAAHKLLDADDGRHVVSEAAARLPSALAGVGFVLAAMGLGALLMESGSAGLVAGALAMTSQGVINYAHNARPEMVYACACSFAIVGLLVLHEHRHDEGRRTRLLAGLGMWSCFAVATLSKGPFLPLFIVAGAAFALARERSLRVMLRVLQPGTGLLLIAATLLPWLWLVLQREAAVETWRTEMFARMGGEGEWWWQPLTGYYVYKTPILILPWLALLPGAIMFPWRQAGALAHRGRFLFWILVGPGVFLSFSKGSGWYYMLPVMGVLCALMAGGVTDLAGAVDERGSARRWLALVTRCHAGLFLAAAAFSVWTLLDAGRGELLEAETRWFGVAVLSLAALVGVAAFCQRQAALKRAWLLLLGSWSLVILGSAGTDITWRLEHRRSEAEFGRQIAALVPPDRPLLASRCEATTFVHYADRHIEVVRFKDLRSRLADSPEAFVLTRKTALAKGVIVGEIVLEQTGDHADSCVLLIEAQRVDGTDRPSGQ